MTAPKSTVVRIRDVILKAWSKELTDQPALEAAESAAFAVCEWVRDQLDQKTKPPRIRGTSRQIEAE